MRADKFTTTIVIETLSVDSVGALLVDVMNQLSNQYRNGKLVSEDGDTSEWLTCSEKVEF